MGASATSPASRDRVRVSDSTVTTLWSFMQSFFQIVVTRSIKTQNGTNKTGTDATGYYAERLHESSYRVFQVCSEYVSVIPPRSGATHSHPVASTVFSFRGVCIQPMTFIWSRNMARLFLSHKILLWRTIWKSRSKFGCLTCDRRADDF